MEFGTMGKEAAWYIYNLSESRVDRLVEMVTIYLKNSLRRVFE